MRYHERIVMLSVLDGLWKDHLLAMDTSRRASACAATPSRTPRRIQKRVLRDVRADDAPVPAGHCAHLFRMQIIGPDGKPIETVAQMQAAQLQRTGSSAQSSLPLPSPARSTPQSHSHPRPLHHHRRAGKRVPAQEASRAGNRPARSAPARAPLPPSASPEKSRPQRSCPCGSGKKYKNATAPR